MEKLNKLQKIILQQRKPKQPLLSDLVSKIKIIENHSYKQVLFISENREMIINKNTKIYVGKEVI